MGDEVAEFKEKFAVALAFSTLVVPMRRYIYAPQGRIHKLVLILQKRKISDHTYMHL
jgi:hypothetical protein